jgi:hypothetical protein
MKKKTLVAVFLVLFVSAASSAVVVNSEDWRDNAMGMSYSHFQGEDVHMVTNLGEGKLIADMLEVNETHTVFESSQAAWPDYTNYLQNQNVEADTREINWNESQYDLYSEVRENVSGFIVVKSGYGIDTISAFPKIIKSDYWLLYYEEDETVRFLEGKNKPVVFYGKYLEQPWLKLNGQQEVINTGTKDSNNLEIVERMLRQTGETSVTAAGDSYIEKGFLKKGSPIIVNQGVSQTVEVLNDQNVSIIEVIGAENVNFGNTIKDNLGESITVIAKFGRRFTGVDGLQGTYPLKKLPVTPVERDISLDEVVLDQENNTLRLVFSNRGNIPTALNFSAVQLGDGTDSVLLSEFRRKKIRSGHSTAMNFETNDSSNVSTASVSFDYIGKTGLTTQNYDLNVSSIRETSEVSLVDLFYSRSDESLVMKVRNTGDRQVWVSGELESLEIFNRTETVLSENEVSVEPDSEKEIIFDVYLTEQQIQENGNLTVKLASGTSEKYSSSIDNYEEVDLTVREGLTGAFWRSTAPGIAVLLIILLAVAYRYGKIEGAVSRLQDLR